MTDDSTMSPPELADASEVAALKAQVEALRAENESLKSQGRAGGSSRTRWALVLIVIASIVVSAAVPAVWLNRVVMSTDAWVETVRPLAADPAIQAVVADSASKALIERLDAATRIESVLPTALAPIAPVIATSVDGFVRDQARALVASPQFEEIWAEANRAGHKLIVASLTGEQDGAVTLEAGVIALDVGTLSKSVQAALVDRGLTFVASVPLDRLDTTVEVFRSPVLAQAQSAIAAMNASALWLPLVALGLIGGAFALAQDRRRVALWLGAGLVIVAVLPLQALYLSQYWLTSQAQQLGSIPTDAAQNAYQIVFRGLFSAERLLAVLGAVVLVSALISGPSKWAVAMRTGLKGGLQGVSAHLDTGAFGVWVAERASAVRATGIAAAVLLLLAMPAPRTIGQLAWVSILAVVWVLAVEVVGGARAAESDDGQPEGPAS